MSEQIDSFFQNLVVDPWRVECAEADHPWEATPALRAKWRQLMGDGNKLAATACALGLGRCAGLSDEEVAGIRHFFVEQDYQVLDSETLAFLLATGGSPPPFLWDSFFAPLLMGATGKLPHTAWHLLAAVMRHPSAVGFAQVLAARLPAELGFVRYWLNVNPCSKEQAAGPNPTVWERALRLFHGQQPRVPLAEVDSHSLCRFAYLLRVDFTEVEYEESCSRLFLENPLFFVGLHNPCRKLGPPPPFAHGNPTRAVLSYFSGDDPVSALYRWYNPLLNAPWLMEDIGSRKDEGPYMGLLLLGAPCIEAPYLPAFDRPLLRSLIEEHPSWVLAAAYLDAKTKEASNERSNPVKKEDGTVESHSG